MQIIKQTPQILHAKISAYAVSDSMEIFEAPLQSASKVQL